MAQGLFIGFTSDTPWALEQVLSLVCAAAAMGICLWTPPEVCVFSCVFLRKRGGLCLVQLEIIVSGKKGRLSNGRDIGQ